MHLDGVGEQCRSKTDGMGVCWSGSALFAHAIKGYRMEERVNRYCINIKEQHMLDYLMFLKCCTLSITIFFWFLVQDMVEG
jgi:hypothetical protein